METAGIRDRAEMIVGCFQLHFISLSVSDYTEMSAEGFFSGIDAPVPAPALLG